MTDEKLLNGNTEAGITIDNTLDVFISYSTKNKNVADAVVANFEQHGIKCWYAPRDIVPGKEWVSAIKEGIYSAKIFILVFTDESNDSRQVMNEVAMAFNAEKTIIPFKLTQKEMNDELEYYLTRVHWLDAVSKSMEKNIENLRKYVEVILQGSNSQKTGPETLKAATTDALPQKTANRKWIIIGAVAVLVILITVGVIIALSGGDSEKTDKPEKVIAENSSENYTKAEKTDENGMKQETDEKADTPTADVNQPEIPEATPTPMIAGPSTPELMESGKEAFYMGNYGTEDNAKAKEYFLQAAEAGDADAYFYLGGIEERMYDFNAAMDYYDKGVKENSNLSRLAMGYLYQTGRGVDGNAQKAWDLYNEALTNGCPEAYYYMAKIVELGLADQEPDANTSIEYYNNVLSKSDNPYFKAMSYYEIGELYRNGGAKLNKDKDKALENFLKMSEKMKSPYIEAMQNMRLGYVYNGKDNEAKSNDYYNRASVMYSKMAEAGFPYAYYMIGTCYRYGRGKEQNYTEAINCLNKADELVKENNKMLCCMEAINYLGIMYEEALGVSQDYDKAFEYYKEAAGQGYGIAAQNIAHMYYYGNIGKLSNGNSDYDRAKQWYEKAVECGNLGTEGDSYNYIGNIYLNGYGKTNIDLDKALEIYQKAEKFGNNTAIYNIGLVYYRKGDFETALSNFLKTEERGYKSSNNYYNIAHIYRDKKGADEDKSKAIKYYELAYDDGKGKELKADEYEFVAFAYYNGKLTEKDFAKAFKWGNIGAETGSVNCMAMLGNIYYKGLEIDADPNKALEWFGKAIDAGVTGDNLSYSKKCIKTMVDEGKISEEAASKWLE